MMTSHDGLAMTGEVLLPGQEGYDQAAATVFASGAPDLVVRPRDASGVAAALRYAAGAGLPVSVRSGGHSPAGYGTSDGGMLIDLRQLREVRVLNHGTRVVRVGAGATWGEVAATLGQAGLALTSGDTASVGVGGLTLAGGIGWMVRRYGLAADAVTAADVVTADGRLVRADARRHPDLLWALRGGGGNFGVVTSLDFTAQPVTAVHFGTIAYRLATPPGTAAGGAPGGLPGLIRGWRDLMRASDENLTTALALVPPMMGRPPMIMLRCCYASADEASATAALAPFRRLAPVEADDVRVVQYAEVLEEGHMPPGIRVQMRNAFLRTLDAEHAAASAALFRDGAAVELRSLGGAFGRVPADATAFAHRDASVFLNAVTMLPPGAPQDAADNALAAWPALAATASGCYTGFLGPAADADIAAAYPAATYQRLARVKRRYDPGNVFRRNHNIPPEGAYAASGTARSPSAVIR
jgi:FAD/FMN-containing dehydrogenase